MDARQGRECTESLHVFFPLNPLPQQIVHIPEDLAAATRFSNYDQSTVAIICRKKSLVKKSYTKPAHIVYTFKKLRIQKKISIHIDILNVMICIYLFIN